jgi:hypothetical protein
VSIESSEICETVERIDEFQTPSRDEPGRDETDRDAGRRRYSEIGCVSVNDEAEQTKVKFPKKPDVLLARESQSLEERRKHLESYLQSLLKNEEFRNHKDLVRHFNCYLYLKKIIDLLKGGFVHPCLVKNISTLTVTILTKFKMFIWE